MTESSNVELARAIFAAWERGDYSSADWADPEIEFVIADGFGAGSWQGLARMAEAWRELLSGWEEHRGEAEEVLELDDQRVLVLAVSRMRGKASGVDVGRLRPRSAVLFQIRGGEVTRLLVYSDRGRALADLGLAPEGDAR